MRKELEVIIRRREITEEDYGDIRTEGKRIQFNSKTLYWDRITVNTLL